ncbi:MAG: hypothetical protein J6Y97_07305 [Prevotella sp.]|nr:hypothetical protein [Prevotella sp.]MBP5508460.1 hypothetical protein [Prevotella sp.]
MRSQVRVLPPRQYQDAVGRRILRYHLRGTYRDTPTVCPPVAPATISGCRSVEILH